jgi:hypothetical protein
MEVGMQLVERLLGPFMTAVVRVCQEAGQRQGLRWHIHLAMRRDQVIDDLPMFPFLTVEHLLHHSLEGRVSGMRLVEFVEDDEGRSRYGRQFCRCFCVAAGQGVRHYVSRAGSKLDAEVKADELASPLMLRDGFQALVEEEF